MKYYAIDRDRLRRLAGYLEVQAEMVAADD